MRIWIIEKGKEGILDDDDLNRNYINIANDIEELIAEGWLRVILTQVGSSKKDQKRVLFPCDRSNSDVEQAKLGKRCHQEISKIWTTQLGDNAVTNWE